MLWFIQNQQRNQSKCVSSSNTNIRALCARRDNVRVQSAAAAVSNSNVLVISDADAVEYAVKHQLIMSSLLRSDDALKLRLQHKA